MAVFKNNHIELTEDQHYIYIKDKMKWHRNLQLVSAILWFVYSISNLYRLHFVLADAWFYYFFLLAWIVFSIIYLKMDVSGKIRKSEISKVSITKTVLGNYGAYILFNSRRRNLGSFDPYEADKLEAFFNQI